MIEYIFKEVMVGKFSKLKEVNKPRIYDSEVSEDSHMCVCVCVCVCVYTLLPGESQGRRSLVDCHLWGRTESDMTEAT